MHDTNPENAPRVLAELKASVPRRIFALLVLVSLGVLLLYLGLATDGMALISRVFLICFGFSALWVAERLRRATGLTITLTEEDMHDSAGRVLAKIDEIKSVSRGTFAFKPSHGFSVRLIQPRPRVWAPGIWWRFGTRIGVGGVTAAPQAKTMSEILTFLVQDKNGG